MMTAFAMYLNLVQIAESFGVSEKVVEDWIRDEGLPHMPDRGRLLFDRAQVAHWAAAHGLGGAGGLPRPGTAPRDRPARWSRCCGPAASGATSPPAARPGFARTGRRRAAGDHPAGAAVAGAAVPRTGRINMGAGGRRLRAAASSTGSRWAGTPAWWRCSCCATRCYSTNRQPTACR